MADKSKAVLAAVLKFRAERDWLQFNSPANFAKSIAIEASEILEHFQWSDNDYRLDELKYELADVYLYLLLLANELDLDLNQLALDKLKINAKKYPVDKARGRTDKYDRL